VPAAHAQQLAGDVVLIEAHKVREVRPCVTPVMAGMSQKVLWAWVRSRCVLDTKLSGFSPQFKVYVGVSVGVGGRGSDGAHGCPAMCPLGALINIPDAEAKVWIAQVWIMTVDVYSGCECMVVGSLVGKFTEHVGVCVCCVVACCGYDIKHAARLCCCNSVTARPNIVERCCCSKLQGVTGGMCWICSCALVCLDGCSMNSWGLWTT